MAEAAPDPFSALLKLPQPSKTAIDSFISIAEANLRLLAALPALAASIATTKDAIRPEEIVNRATATFQPAIDKQYAKIRAQKGCTEEIANLLTEIIDGLDALAHWSARGSEMVMSAGLRVGGGSNPWLHAQTQIENALRRLKRLAPKFHSPQPLTEAQQQIWDALKGRFLTSKQLSKATNSDYDEVRIRQLVLAIRNADRNISHRPGRGYFRPDEPPPDL